MKERSRSLFAAIGAFVLGALLTILALVPMAVVEILGLSDRLFLVLLAGVITMAVVVMEYGLIVRLRPAALFLSAFIGAFTFFIVVVPGFPGIAMLQISLYSITLGTLAYFLVERFFPGHRRSAQSTV